MNQFKLFCQLIISGSICVGAAKAQDLSNKNNSSEPVRIVVTATREAKAQSEVSETVGVLEEEEIEFISPSHPSEALNRIPGVHVNNLGGEGHMTSIRQPITTSGVYLYLEDGVPTRPTGLFNHNALYEINVPQAERLEVIKGPGSALYGSDSIGGVINSITRPAPREAELELNPEFGSYGWKRLLSTVGAPITDDSGFRLDLNLTDNDGYRESSDYSRYSGTLRFDGAISSETKFKTILSLTEVDQNGVSTLQEDDYRNNPQKNIYRNDIARREVESVRASTEFAYEPDSTNLYTLTPFVRDNQMDLMPFWMLPYDPNLYTTKFHSFGMMAKYRRKIDSIDGEFITGLDIDHSPSQYLEKRISLITNSEGLITDYLLTGRTNYDFDADQTSISPYIHTDWQAAKKVRLDAGLRYDYFTVDYKDNLGSDVPEQQFGFGGFNHLRPDSQTISYDQFSPKLGAIYELGLSHDAFANYRHSFRTPSVGQLFRSGSSVDSADLSPVKTNSFEIGLRGASKNWLNYELTVYHQIIEDDIVSYIDNLSGDRRVTNAGETEHQGIEIGLSGNIFQSWSYALAWAFTNQEYNDFTAVYGFPAKEINYAGNKVAQAPRRLGNTTIRYRPNFIPDTTLELEWEHLGDYYTDETNTQEYSGHDLLNFRTAYQYSRDLEIYGRIMNITDELYSTQTSNQVGSSAVEYRPGLPRTYYAGIRLKF